jgi:glycogen(starch) synthase
MFEFCNKTRRQRINQRNRTERLSDVLDWNRMGLEYVKARWVAVRRKFPKSANENSDDENGEFGAGYESDYNTVNAEEDLSKLRYVLHLILKRYHQKVPRPPSVPGSPRLKSEFDDLASVAPHAYLFDDNDKEGLNVNVIINELKALGVNGTSKSYIPSE